MFACISIVDNIDIFKKKSVKVIPADEMQYQAVDNKNVSSLKVNILKQVLFHSPNFSFSVLKMPHTAVEFKLQFTRALTKSNMKSFNSPRFRLLHSFYVREVLPKLLWCTKCLYCYVKRVKVLPFDIYMYVKDIVQISGIFRTLQARTKRQCPNNSFMYV